MGNIASSFSPLDFLFAGLTAFPDGPFSGLHGAVGPMLLSRLARQPSVTLLLVPDQQRASQLYEESRVWLGRFNSRVSLFLPERHSVYDQTPAAAEVLQGRLAALGMGVMGGGLIIAPIQAAAERFFHPQRHMEACRHFSPGTSIDREEFLKQLARLGYLRVTRVEEPGQVAVRGSLIDLYSPHSEFPVRLDLFGDEIDSIKAFSPSTQRTIDALKEFALLPSREHLIDPEEISALLRKIQETLPGLDPTRAELLQRRAEHLQTHPDSRDLQELWPFLHPGKDFFWGAWPKVRVLVDQPDQTEEALEGYLEEIGQLYAKNSDVTPLLPPDRYYFSLHQVQEALLAANARTFSRFRTADEPGCTFEVEPVPPPNANSRESLLQNLRFWLDRQWAVALIVADEDRFHNLKGLLGERHFPIRSSPDPMALTAGSILITQGVCTQGFLASQEKIAVLGESDLFGFTRGTTPAKPSRKSTSGEPLALTQLVPGDFVVHVDHGIASYQGIHTLSAAGNEREYLLLQYAGSDKLYVPTDQIHKVQKYIGMEGATPSIHSLNSKVWEHQKRRVQKNIEAIAKELLELYAQRHTQEGFAFPPDCELETELEHKFSFVETPDQLKAIVETKKDMQAQTPMDRLICGDVGFGKTEVALRAAFKAICAGKQVAILAPTTLLAFQHEQTFRQRLQEFPVQVGMVSRLVKPKLQKEILEKVKAGTMDVLIGTHRILSHDIKFKDLGLLVVDEEQRFGVKNKERLKQLRVTVDVLTMTATPIPRTMQMALSGIRQISIINTPPENRRPIQTYVAPFDPAWAKRAILEEMRRGGQIFYVFNRVERIEQKAAFLRELVPEARIVVAHGQMDEELVEKTMLAFIHREFDVLLSTTIIESGLDIPNANTLIIEESERLGLSQMYQLRGRVGRSHRQAFSYFFYSKSKRLSQEAQERLATIEEHTALGSGFKIAMRDLQIRGAGNLLGEAQSGHIAAIGFALYMELLEETVKKLKGQVVARSNDAAIEIPFTALLPAHYIPDEETRIEMYSRLARCQENSVIDLLRIECEDRFGALPPEAERLLQVARLRLAATRAGVLKMTRLPNHLKLEFDPKRSPKIDDLFATRSPWLRRMIFSPSDPNSVLLETALKETDPLLEQAADFLGFLQGPDGS